MSNTCFIQWWVFGVWTKRRRWLVGETGPVTQEERDGLEGGLKFLFVLPWIGRIILNSQITSNIFNIPGCIILILNTIMKYSTSLEMSFWCTIVTQMGSDQFWINTELTNPGIKPSPVIKKVNSIIPEKHNNYWPLVINICVLDHHDLFRISISIYLFACLAVGMFV